MDILNCKGHLHILHTSIFSGKVYCQTLVMNWNPLWPYSADNAWLNFHFLSPSLTKTIPWKSQMRPQVCVCTCVSVWEALDIKVNFNKVWRLAGGMGETCQAQMLSLCVPSHPVFTSSGQLAAFSVYWTSWQSHIFTMSSIWIIKKSLQPMTVTVKQLKLTVYGKC